MQKTAETLAVVLFSLLIATAFSSETKVYRRIRLPELLSFTTISDEVEQYTWIIDNPVLLDERTNLGWMMSQFGWVSDVLRNYRGQPPWLQTDIVHRGRNEHVKIVFDSVRNMRFCEVSKGEIIDGNIKPFELDQLKALSTINLGISSSDIDFNDYSSIIDNCQGKRNPLAAASSNNGRYIEAFRFPGTKWCGSGSSAKDYNDLGSATLTDMCCRTHDHCKDNIRSNERSGDFVNLAKWTISSCHCDDEFMLCLESNRDKTSNGVGNIYFNILKVNCFLREKVRVCKMKRIFYCTKFDDKEQITLYQAQSYRSK